MASKDFLETIARLNRCLKVSSDYDPDGSWFCRWQGKYGSGGDLTLDECIDLIWGYIETTERESICKCHRGIFHCECASSPSAQEKIRQRVRTECLKNGQASGEDDWWSIHWGAGICT